MKYMIIGLFLLFAGNIYAQVRGTVKDSTGGGYSGCQCVLDEYRTRSDNQRGW